MSSSDSSNNSKTSEGLQELPAGYVPGEHDVVIGKGKKFYFHTGNQWLRTLVSSMLEEYKQAQTKSDKSNIISDVVEYVRQNGRFVKRDLKSGKWVFAEPLLCREKCSQTFRDNLAETYRSSNVAKRNKRRAEQQEKKRSSSGGPESTAAKRLKLQQAAQVQASYPPLQQQQAMQQAMQQAQQQPIPSNLFDLEMPLWSPKHNVSLLPGNLDFGALTRGRNSITGTAGNFNNAMPNNDHSGGLNGLNLNFQASANNMNQAHQAQGNPPFQLSGLSSMNLLQNLPDILANLGQIAQANGQAQAHHQANQDQPNPFEPTPLTTGQLPPLTGVSNGHFDLSAAAAALQGGGGMNMPSLGGDAATATGNIFEPRPIQEKRHSLAMVSDLDWLKASSHVGAGADEEAQNPKISAAFAA